MPRTPLVISEKVKYKLETWDGADEREVPNYKSAVGYELHIEKLFREEEKLGWMMELTNEEAQKLYGDRLRVGALGVVDEGDKIRVVHDATHGIHVNHNIRPKDQVKCPGAGELITVLEELREKNVKAFCIMGDASKAHRRIKVRKSDWAYQACRISADKV